jgi:hypothetical protein
VNYSQCWRFLTNSQNKRKRDCNSISHIKIHLNYATPLNSNKSKAPFIPRSLTLCFQCGLGNVLLQTVKVQIGDMHLPFLIIFELHCFISKRLSRLNLILLETRKRRADLIMTFKVLYGHIATTYSKVNWACAVSSFHSRFRGKSLDPKSS